MLLTCKRRKTNNQTTLGELFADDVFLCYTLEDEIREIKGQPVNSWKIEGQTAIPEGKYRLTLEDSKRFGPETMTLNLVPGFTSIRVHAGNNAEDTHGCPLLGLAITGLDLDDGGYIMGGTSKPAVEKVKALVKQSIECDEEVFWKVVNPI